MKLSRRHFIQGTATAGLTTAVSGAIHQNRWPRNIASAAEGLPPLSIVEAGERLRAASLTAVELTEHYLGCIRVLNPELNAFITVTEDEALAGRSKISA